MTDQAGNDEAKTVAEAQPADAPATNQGTQKGLFRFRPINKFLYTEILERFVWFSKPKSFNDPFEFSYSIDNLDAVILELISIAAERGELTLTNKSQVKYLTTGLKEDLTKQLKALYEEMMDRGVCCFTASNTNTLLWAHYADGHRGVCLEYKTATFGDKTRQVKYAESPPVVRLRADGLHLDGQAFAAEFLRTKSTDWKYEEEIRVVADTGNKRVTVGPDDIVRAYFGLMTPKEDADPVARALKLVHPNIKFSVARHVDNNYKIKFEEVDFVN